MRRSPRLAPPSWLRLPARTARLRLTMLYGVLFLASSAGVLAITYLLVSDTTQTGFYINAGHRSGINAGPRSGIMLSGPGTADSVRSGHLSGAPAAAVRRAQLPQLLQQHASDLHHLLIWSAIALAIMAVISIALGYYVAGRVLNPLRTITSMARAISARNLGERLALDGPEDEFKALGDTLDDLLTRLQTAFDAQQHFVANASHELRTPLSWERSLVEVALADPDPTIGSFQCMCQELLAASDQQQRLIEALLTLATSERGLEHHEPIDLSTLADSLLLAPWPEADQLEIAIAAKIDPAPTSGHAALAERLIANLIDNAIHHNTPGGHVEITTGVRDQHAFVTVTNSGPMIPVDEIQRLFQPFQRLGGARTQHTNGHGLGLSIVQAIATAHDATITTHAQPDGGLAIEVSFPRSEKPRERLGAQMPAPA
jgi:signal transduction histidine kinase